MDYPLKSVRVLPGLSGKRFLSQKRWRIMPEAEWNFMHHYNASVVEQTITFIGPS